MARYRYKDRLKELTHCANQLSWDLNEKDEYGMLKWLLDFHLFKKGGSKKISPMLMHKKDDLEFSSLFDYAYTVSTGKTTVTFRQTVYFRYSKSLALPHFIMVPEKWYHRLGTFFGMQDIDFVEYPSFSHNYLLQGRDEDYIRYHFDHPDMISFFNQQGFYSMEGMNYLFVLYVNNVLLPAEQALQLVTIGDHLHDYLANKTPDISLPLMEVPERDD